MTGTMLTCVRRARRRPQPRPQAQAFAHAGHRSRWPWTQLGTPDGLHCGDELVQRTLLGVAAAAALVLAASPAQAAELEAAAMLSVDAQLQVCMWGPVGVSAAARRTIILQGTPCHAPRCMPAVSSDDQANVCQPGHPTW